MTLFLLNLISLAFFLALCLFEGGSCVFFMLKIEDILPCSRHGRFKKKKEHMQMVLENTKQASP